MFKLILLFLLVPLVELALLIELSKVWGTLTTVALIVVTGFLGAVLARHQGLAVLREMRREAEGGQLPARPIFDGAMILVAGAMLLTPGILTDLAGFLLLVPLTRRIVGRILWRLFQSAVRKGRIQVSVHRDERHSEGPVIWRDPDE